MQFLQFLDRLIPYDTFLNDLAARIVKYLKSDNADPEFVSQRKAYEMFGRRNVERWRRQVEYRTADLRLLQRTVQDYFDNTSSDINRNGLDEKK